VASPANVTPEFLEALNELLKTASPMGAYSMGAVCYLAWKSGAQPDRQLLESARNCEDYRLADFIFAEWQEHRRQRRAG
jgi:hypothetical protein